MEVTQARQPRGRGALLRVAVSAVPDVNGLSAVCPGEPISLAFAVRHGFVPVGEHQVSGVDPATVPPVGLPPRGGPQGRLDVLDGRRRRAGDPQPLCGVDDPSGLASVFTRETFLADWWNSPTTPRAVLGARGPDRATPVVAAFTNVQVDRSGAGLERDDRDPPRLPGPWAGSVGEKQRALNEVAAAGITEALTANDATNRRCSRSTRPWATGRARTSAWNDDSAADRAAGHLQHPRRPLPR